jgi:predicted PhzF superfamily epimerase YddE/YHI9
MIITMTSYPIYQVDAFTSHLLAKSGSSCPLKEWLPEETMQRLAFENNLSETAFL